MQAVKIILTTLGGLLILLSLPLLGFGLLGLVGILADVGPAENREFGFQFLTYGIPAFLVGVILLSSAFMIRVEKP